MYIINTTFNIIFDKNTSIRKKVLKDEDRFLDFYLNPSIHPIPDDAPEQIPRVQMMSKNGHSNLSISQTTASLATGFDENFRESWDKCKEYMNERYYHLHDLLDDFTDKAGFNFYGLVTQVIFDEIDNPVESLYNRLFGDNNIPMPYDLGTTLTYVVDDYYVNLNISNVRYFEGFDTTQVVSLNKFKELDHRIGVTVDINNRHAFNSKEGYKPSKSDIDKLIDITGVLLEGNLYDFLKGGVLKYEL